MTTHQPTDVFRLDGYVALVTGAGRGIGAGIALTFARAGADVVLVARTAADLEDVAAAIRAAGRSATVIPSDVSDVSQATKIVERTVAEHGRLDILVNNAGGAMPARTSRQPLKDSMRHSTSMSPRHLNSPSARLRICSTAAVLR